MKFAFCTCVRIGLSCINSIYENNGKLHLLITLDDNKAKNKSGRIYLDDFSKKNRVPILKITHINEPECIIKLKELNIDWLFIIGWSQIASKKVLQSVNCGVVGAHPTLLPEGRGRAAIPWTILKGLKKPELLFKMNEGVDTGLILAQKEIHVEEFETASTLYEKVNQLHFTLIKNLYNDLVKNEVIGVIQDESKSSYWPGRTPKDGEFFVTNSTSYVDRLVRATTKPYPGAFIIIEDIKYIVWSGKIGKSKGFHINLRDGYYTMEKYEKIIL